MQGKVQHRLCRSAKRSLANATASFVLIALCALQLVSPAKADIVNSADAVGTYNSTAVTSAVPATATIPVGTPNAAITLTKIDKGFTDVNANGVRDPGDKINYGFVVTNTGNVTINNITLTDVGTVVAGGPISVLPGASDTTSFTATYTLTPADFIAGNHTNAATVNGVAATPGATPVSASNSITTSLTYVAAFSFTKSAVLTSTPPKVNDVVNYTLTVTNTGDSPLFNVTISDPLLASNEKLNSRMMALIDTANKADADTFATAALDDVPHQAGAIEAANRRAVSKLHIPQLSSEFHASRQLVRMSGKTGPLVAGEKIGFVYAFSNAGEGPLSDIRVAQPDSFAFGSVLSLLNPNETDAASIIFTRDLTDADIAAGSAHSNGYVTWNDRGHEKMAQLAENLPLSSIKVFDQFATASITPVSVPRLDPAQSTTFTAPYILKQADIDAGTLHNLATATAKDIGNLTVTHTATNDLTLPQVPAVGVVKTGTLATATPGVPMVGDTISYQFAVTNLGNVTLNPAIVNDPTPGVSVSGAPIGSLAPGVTNNTSYTATHVLTQVDIDAGFFKNQAIVTATPPLTPAITSLSDPLNPLQHNQTIVPISQKPAIALLKQVASIEDVNGNGRNDAGDKIHYLFTVKNTGNVTLTAVNVTDKLGAPVVITGSPLAAPLAPGNTDTGVTGVYVITQADMNAGQVTNTATATGTAPDATKVSDDSDPALLTGNAPTVQPLTQVPQAALFKKQVLWKDNNNDGFVDAGDELDYAFIVQNTGNVTLTNVNVTDLMAGAVVSGNAPGITLDPGLANAATFTATYIITPADEAAGFVKNRAQLDATQIGGILSNSGDLTSSTPGTTDTSVQPAPKIGIDLLPPSYVDTNGNGIVDAGDTLTYQVQVKNTGLVPVTGVTVVDANASALLAITGGPIGTLLPGAVDTTTFAATHVLTPADIAAGIYNAQAKASGTASTSSGPKIITDLSHPNDFTKDAPTPYVIGANPQIVVLKTFNHYENASGTTVPAPSTGAYAVYTITVRNTGNIDFDIVTIAEKAGFNGTIIGSTPFALPLGTVDSTHFSAKHLITDAEMLAGHFDNQVVATGNNTTKGLTATDDSDATSLTGNAPTVVAVSASPQAALFKKQSGFKDNNNDGLLDAGDEIDYAFAVQNTGNVTLTNVTLTDLLPGAVVAGNAPGITLAVGATDSTSFTAKYIVTTADATAGIVKNQARLDTTQVTNVLSRSGDPVSSVPGTTDTPISPTPSIAVVLQPPTYFDSNGDGVINAGDTLTYPVQVKNNSTVPVTSVSLSDANANNLLTFSPTSLATIAAGATDTTTFTANHVLTTADVVAGFYNAQGKVTGSVTSSTGSLSISDLSDPADFTKDAPTPYLITANPQIAVLKIFDHFENATGTVLTAPVTGAITVYKVSVKNTGNVDFDNVIIAENAGFTGAVIGTTPFALAAGAIDTTHFSVKHVITNADMIAGQIANQVVATGSNTAKGLTATDNSDSASFTGNAPTVTAVTANPQIAIVKIFTVEDVNNDGLNDGGDIIHYSFTVANQGNVDLTNVTIADANAVLPTPVPVIATLKVGTQDTTTFTATHLITATETTSGVYSNQAIVSGVFDPTKPSITTNSDNASLTATIKNPTVTTLTSPNPQAALFKKQVGTKDNNGDGVLDVGDEIDYVFTVQNTGNVTLTNVTLTDLLPGAVVNGNAPGITLAPGAIDSTTFKGSYIITPADATAGVVKNQARLDTTQVTNVISRNGDPLGSLPGTTDSVISPTPTVAAVLAAPVYVDTNGDGVVDAGDTLTYPVQVKNTSTVPLTSIQLADANANSLLTINGTFSGTLAAGATDTTSFTATHVITAGDVAAGIYNAQVKVSAKTVTGTIPITDLSDSTDFTKDAPTPYVITPNPQIAVLKIFDHYENAASAVQAGPATGVIAVYRISVKNTGNVDFDNVIITENAGFTGAIIGTTPFALATGATDTAHFSAKHVITNADMVAGQIANQVMATGSNTARGISATDISDAADFKGNVPTTINVVANPQIAIVKIYKVEDVNGNGANDMGDVIHYSFTVANLGNVDLTNVTITDAAAVLPTPVPVIAVLPVGAQDTTTFTASHVIVTSEVTSGAYANQATAAGVFDPAKPAVTSDSDNAKLTATTKHPTVTPLSIAKPVLTKTADRAQVKRGEVVNYTITGLNLSSIQYQVADIMPPGFNYVAGSATANGVAVTPMINGQILTFNGLVPTASKLVVKLRLTASSTLGGGKYVNTARIIQQDNNNVLAVAQATVEVVPEAVFDCSDIIGRVFDDLNGDGYYQPGEPGLPGVRLATVNGILITTDDQGRYHVPCAAIPDAAIGSNFLLKLDPRTLPTGYKVTTENPRDVRVTRGKMTELNFGAAKHHDVRVDVSGKAFDPDGTDLTPAWASGVSRLCKVMIKTKADLLIAYHQGGETGELAQARVDALEAKVRSSCDAKNKMKIKTQVEEGK